MTRKDRIRENTRFTNFMARLFASDEGKTFGAMEANGVLVVIARAGTTRERDLRDLVERSWGATTDKPRPR